MNTLFHHLTFNFFKEDQNSFRRYILKKNLDQVVLYCSVMTFLLLLNIMFTIETPFFLNASTVLLILYLVIIIASIFIKRYKVEQVHFIVILLISFLIITHVWLFIITLNTTSIIQFYYFYILMIMLLSLVLTILPTANIIVSLMIGLVGFNHLMSHYQTTHEHRIIIVALVLFSIASNYHQFVLEIRHFELSKSINEKNAFLKQLAQRDTLTNLYTNQHVFDQLEHEESICLRYNFPLSVMLIDIDNFKRTNEIHGQVYGDDNIITISNIITSSTRSSDIVGRYGGKTFIVVLPNTNLEESLILAERIRLTAHHHQFPFDEKITVSIGLSSYKNTSIKDLISETNLLLKDAKSSGKNCVKY